MFLPMSWMSPWTVQMTILPFEDTASEPSAPAFASLMASKPALAASADAMSWGKKNLPFSKRSPTSSSAGMSTSLIA